MAKAHEGLPPSNLPDATSAAVPASDLQGPDPLAQLAGDGTLPVDGAAQPPAEAAPPKRSTKTIVDLIGGLFGGDN
jgi:hypothetical protein